MKASKWPYLNHKAYGFSIAIQNSLKKQKILAVEDVSDWYCNDCGLEHPFDIVEGKLYKTCFNYSRKNGSEATEEDTQTLWLDLLKLTEVIVQKNYLARKLLPTQPKNGWFIGLYSDYAVWLTQNVDYHALKASVVDYQAMVPQKNLLLTTLFPVVFLPDEEAFLKSKGISLISLLDIVENDWVFPSSHQEPKYRLIVDTHSKGLKLDGVSISLPPREFVTALLIARSSNGLPEHVYDAEYYNQYIDCYGSSNEASSPLMRQAVTQINKAIKIKTGVAKVFESNRQLKAYVVLDEFSPAQIL